METKWRVAVPSAEDKIPHSEEITGASPPPTYGGVPLQLIDRTMDRYTNGGIAYQRAAELIKSCPQVCLTPNWVKLVGPEVILHQEPSNVRREVVSPIEGHVTKQQGVVQKSALSVVRECTPCQISTTQELLRPEVVLSARDSTQGALLIVVQ